MQDIRFKQLIVLMALAAPLGAWAQRPAGDTTMGGTTIEVIQSYKPKVRQAPKPEWIPQLPAADTSHPSFTYEVPAQTIYYGYRSLPLRPMPYKDSTKLPFKNYVKLGGGNLSTIFLDAGIGSLSGKTYETGIHLHHLSQKGDIKFQQSSLSGLEADMQLHQDKTEWHIGIDGARNDYYNYGFENTQTADSLRQTYYLGRLSVDMQNKDGKDVKFLYHPAINASYYAASFNTNETTIGFDLPLTYKFDPIVDAVVAVNGAITSYKQDTGTSISNNIFAVVPGIRVHSKGFEGRGLVGFAIGKADGLYVLPDIYAGYTTKGAKFTIGAGWQSSLRQNTYEQLSSENPYMYNTYTPLQTRKDEVYLLAQGGAGAHFAYSGRISYMAYDQLAEFANHIANQKQFQVLYDRVNAFGIQLGARYQVANKSSIGLTAAFYSFNGDMYKYVWHEPSTRIKADFMLNASRKLSLGAYLYMLDGIYALDISNNAVKLKTIADMGLNAEFLIIPRLSVFAQVNNLFNSQYQRWRGYQAYGFNIYGGLRLKF